MMTPPPIPDSVQAHFAPGSVWLAGAGPGEKYTGSVI